MSREKQKQLALVTIEPTASTRVEPESFADRDRDDLRAPEAAEWWLRKGLAFRGGACYEEAFACYERGIQLQPDHAEIQFMLGVSFDCGEGVPKNDAIATAWYRKAAEQRHPEAQYNLGLSYCLGWADGSGLGPNYEQAANWFRKAVEQGYERALDRLRFLYALGLVVPQDPAEVVRCYRSAAVQGDKTAQRILGDSYRGGPGAFQDYEQAAWWYHEAALQQDLSAQISLAQMYSEGLVLMSLYFGFVSNEGNCEDALPQWGFDEVLYRRHGCTEAAAYWFAKAARQGSEVAASALAELQPLLTSERVERAKKTIALSNCHINFGPNVEARKKHAAEIRDAVNVLENAGYKLRTVGWGYELDIQEPASSSGPKR